VSEYFSLTYVPGTAGVAEGDPEEAFRVYAQEVHRLMKEFVPVNKNPRAKERGALRASMVMVILGESDGAVATWAALDYVFAVIDGAKPHAIYPKAGKALSFEWDASQSSHGPFSHSLGTPVPSAPRISARGLPAGFTFSAAGAAARAAATPRNQLYLHNQAGKATKVSRVAGKVAFAHVNHPGNKANDFIQLALDGSVGALEAMEEKIGTYVEVYANDAMAQAMGRL
jgi:hypothetical protein